MSKRVRPGTPAALADRRTAADAGTSIAVRLVALVALTLFAYLPVARGGFIWDDDLHVTANTLLRTGEGLVAIWLRPGAILQYYPLTHTSFWIEFHLWGLAPSGYHIVN